MSLFKLRFPACIYIQCGNRNLKSIFIKLKCGLERKTLVKLENAKTHLADLY